MEKLTNTKILKYIVRDTGALALYFLRLTKPNHSLFSVITFHRVMPSKYMEIIPLPHLAVTPEVFSFFCHFFSENYTCLPLSEAAYRWNNSEIFNKPLLSITFDDGQLDNYIYGAPILEHFGIKATFFLTAQNVDSGELIWHDRIAYILRGYCEHPSIDKKIIEDMIGVKADNVSNIELFIKKCLAELKKKTAQERIIIEKNLERFVSLPELPSICGMMNWDQAVDLAKNGHEIGCHSMTHDLLVRGNAPDLYNEVHDAKRLVEGKIGMRLRCFAYPNGSFDNLTSEAVKSAGFDFAVSTSWGKNKRNYNKLSLKRMELCIPRDLSWNGHPSASLLSWRLSNMFKQK